MPSSGSMRAQIGTLIIATSVIQLANGFFGTLISLRVASADFGAVLAGLVLSSYFAGFTLGAVRCGKIIERVGHIRAYAAFAGLVVAATAAMPLLLGPLSWFVLRAIVGFGCVGVFVTTESWLNAKAQPSERGRVFSLYMVGTFLALAVGQLLIARIEIEGAGPRLAGVGRFYNKRGTAEQWIKEGKQAVKMARLSCHRFRSNEVRLWLSVTAYNLGNLWRRLALPKRIETWSPTSLQQRLVKTGGRLVKHARYYWLLLAESHLTRPLFGSMVRRIDALPLLSE